jgi:chorismate dehydratase
MTYPIAMIPYANMGPYRALGVPAGCRFESLAPRQATIALEQGRVLAAPAPVGDLPRLGNQVDLLGPYGIAAAGAVESVLLLSDRPLAEMARPATIYLTGQSSSSVRLLYLIMGAEIGFHRLPVAVDRAEDADCEMLIGDQALLRARNANRAHITDLAAVWTGSRGLPFVFARWVIRRDAPAEVRSALEHWLTTFSEQEEQLVAAAVPIEARRLGLGETEMLTYLQRMSRVLGEAELAGQARFLDELRHNGREPLFPPLQGLLPGERITHGQGLE